MLEVEAILGDKHHEKGKKKLKKNTFLDYIACANHLNRTKIYL